MEREELNKNFIKTVILLFELGRFVKDNFFSDKLIDKTSSFMTDYLCYLVEREKHNVAQHPALLQTLTYDLNGLIEICGDLRYFKIVNSPLPLLKAEAHLLSLKLAFINERKNMSSKNSNSSVGEEDGGQRDHQRKTELLGLISREKVLNSSKRKILEYIKSYPNSRTKDIIYEFNVLSGRTVKRNLSDLLETGFLKKKVKNGATHYLVNE